MALTYATWKTTIANLMVVPEDDANFEQIIPAIIDFAEGRIYRDLDLQSEIVTDTSATLSADTRSLVLPAPAEGSFNVVEQINLVESNSRTPLVPVSRELLDFQWPSNTAGGNASQRPTSFAMKNATTVSFGPVSGASVSLEIVGQVKPVPLSESNTETYLTRQLPDLFIVASMVFATGYQQNFGSQSDNPAMAVSWESLYEKLLPSADQNADRAEFAGASWTPKSVQNYAVPQRG